MANKEGGGAVPSLSEDRQLVRDVMVLDPDIIDKFDGPDDGVGAVFKSLCYHVEKFFLVQDKTSSPNQKGIEKLLDVLERYMKGIAFIMPSKPPSYPEFKDLFSRNVDMSISPGFPGKASDIPRTVSLWALDMDFYMRSRLEEHYRAFLARLECLEQEPTSDLINLFVKHEPHKIGKIKKSAFRLISGVGITDNLVAYWLYEDLVSQIAERHQELPIQIGLTIRNGG